MPSYVQFINKVSGEPEGGRELEARLYWHFRLPIEHIDFNKGLIDWWWSCIAKNAAVFNHKTLQEGKELLEEWNADYLTWGKVPHDTIKSNKLMIQFIEYLDKYYTIRTWCQVSK